jgi:hypothetical protein
MPKLVRVDKPQKHNNFERNMEIFDTLEIFVIDNLSDNDWKKPIVDYLEDPIGPTDEKLSIRLKLYNRWK